MAGTSRTCGWPGFDPSTNGGGINPIIEGIDTDVGIYVDRSKYTKINVLVFVSLMHCS